MARSASSSLRAPRPPWSLESSPGARRFARAGSRGDNSRAVGSSGGASEEDAEAEGSGVGRPARRSSSPANGASSSGPSAAARAASLCALLNSLTSRLRRLRAATRSSRSIASRVATARWDPSSSVSSEAEAEAAASGGASAASAATPSRGASSASAGSGRTLTPRRCSSTIADSRESGKRSAFAAAGCAHHGSAFSTLPHADACPRFAESAGFGGSSSARQRVGSNPSRLAVGARRCCGDADADEERGAGRARCRDASWRRWW